MLVSCTAHHPSPWLPWRGWPGATLTVRLYDRERDHGIGF
jgi:hypothetical protein